MRIIYKVLVKDGKERVFKMLADKVLIPEARNIAGCQFFSLFQNTQNSSEFIFHELWQAHADVDAYKQRLIEILGEPHPGEEFPAQINDLIKEDEDLI
jgi:quinol monooxygenase YgiN